MIKITRSTRGRLFFPLLETSGSGAEDQYTVGILSVVGVLSVAGTVQSVPCSSPGLEQGLPVSSGYVTNIPKLKGLKH